MSASQKMNWWLIVPALAFLAYILFVFFAVLVPSGELLQNNIATSVVTAAGAFCLYYLGLGVPRLRTPIWIIGMVVMIVSGILAF